VKISIERVGCIVAELLDYLPGESSMSMAQRRMREESLNRLFCQGHSSKIKIYHIILSFNFPCAALGCSQVGGISRGYKTPFVTLTQR
jgi:hypothetical protein